MIISYLRQLSRRRKIYKGLMNIKNRKSGANSLSPIEQASKYFNCLRAKDPVGAYAYSLSCPEPVIYGSIYAAMFLHLTGGLQSLSEEIKNRWADYINRYQFEDGLFRDSKLECEIAEVEDWWGWRHLSAHAITALTVLGSRPKIPFRFFDSLCQKGKMSEWMGSLNWKERMDFSSNAVMNYGVMLQFNRDIHGVDKARVALEEMFCWLDNHQDPKIGLWGLKKPKTPWELSISVQTAYHLWMLYFYDRRPIQYIEKCIDSCLETQNKMGGFGVAYNSSACEDMDSIDPLCRFYFMTEYRRDDIRRSLHRALDWIVLNQNDDGGFVFRRFERLRYGHDLMTTGLDESAAFPTWFRTLSIAYISKVLTDHPILRNLSFNFINCPGYQFWMD